MRALLVEDDANTVAGASLLLRGNNIIVDTTDSGEEAIELTRRYDYDAIILDVLLPDIEGYEVVRRIRASKIDAPILLLSSLGRPDARARGLALGADDFVTKPFDKAELLARINAIVRRSKGLSHALLTIGNMRLDMNSKEIFVGDNLLHLTGKEFAVFELLATRRGSVLSKETFLNHLYGGMDEPEIKIIDVFICKLRKKMAMAGATPTIGTVWGRGYVLREPNQLAEKASALNVIGPDQGVSKALLSAAPNRMAQRLIA